ncbi:20348_t:CDS:2, partial [Cetraspora pellucida]
GCWYRGAGQLYNLIWEWSTFYGWMDASILYCAIVIIMVIRKLNLVANQIDGLDFSSTSRSSSHPPLISKSMILSVVRRVIWYPVILLAQFSGGLSETYFYINHVIPYPITIICFIGMSIQGFLNALVFSQDIAVTQWLRYMLLIKLFSPPNIPSRVISSNHLSSINSVVNDNLDNQNTVQDSSIELAKRISRISEEFKEIETTLSRL